jgi:hypothetical protein
VLVPPRRSRPGPLVTTRGAMPGSIVAPIIAAHMPVNAAVPMLNGIARPTCASPSAIEDMAPAWWIVRHHEIPPRPTIAAAAVGTVDSAVGRRRASVSSATALIGSTRALVLIVALEPELRRVALVASGPAASAIAQSTSAQLVRDLPTDQPYLAGRPDGWCAAQTRLDLAAFSSGGVGSRLSPIGT